MASPPDLLAAAAEDQAVSVAISEAVSDGSCFNFGPIPADGFQGGIDASEATFAGSFDAFSPAHRLPVKTGPFDPAGGRTGNASARSGDITRVRRRLSAARRRHDADYDPDQSRHDNRVRRLRRKTDALPHTKRILNRWWTVTSGHEAPPPRRGEDSLPVAIEFGRYEIASDARPETARSRVPI